jgi:hypothetical protein
VNRYNGDLTLFQSVENLQQTALAGAGSGTVSINLGSGTVSYSLSGTPGYVAVVAADFSTAFTA